MKWIASMFAQQEGKYNLIDSIRTHIFQCVLIRFTHFIMLTFPRNWMNGNNK